MVGIRLDEAQQAATMSDAAPLLLLAGPGTGKTEVLVQRVIRRCETDPDFDPRRALIATFTRRAAQQLWARLAAAGIRCGGALGTFHSVALRQIRQYEASRDLAPTKLLSARRRLITELVSDRRSDGGRRASRDTGGGRNANRAAEMNLICAEIDWACARGIDPQSYAAADGPARLGSARAAGVAKLYARFAQVKAERNLMDFDDVLLRCRQLMDEDKSFAAQQRWSLRHFFVDEFQDVNPMQFELLTTWLDGRDDLFCVGDPNQSIYGWNGAERSYLLNFDQHFEGTATLALVRNRRSNQALVVAAEAALGAGDRVSSIPQVCAATGGEPPKVIGFKDAVAEAEGIARLVAKQRSGASRRATCAVLARTNAQLGVISQALQAAKVPYKLAGGRGGTGNGGGGLLDAPDVAELRAELASARDIASALSDYAYLMAIGTGPSSKQDGSARDSSEPEELSSGCRRLLELAQQYVREDPAELSGAGFVGWLKELAPADIDPIAAQDGVVDLVTFHAAKGLQWKHVCVAGVSKGLVPIKEDDAEERRLLYVALTRAKESVYITWSDERGRSAWLDAIEAANTREPASAQKAAAAIASARQALQQSAVDDSELERLRRAALLENWREDFARATGAQPAAVLDDGLIGVIAANGLVSLEALATATGLSELRLGRLYLTLTEQLPQLVVKPPQQADQTSLPL